MIKPCLMLIKRDLRLSFIRGSEGLTTPFFFVMTICLFPFALGGEQALLQKAAPGIIWVSAVLASLLTLEGLYHRDAEDGTFDLLMLSSVPVPLIAAAKIMTHWLIAGVTLCLVTLPVSQMFFIPAKTLLFFIPSLLLGTLYMSLLGGMGAVLTFGTRRPGLLLALLVLPLYIPMLILGMMGAEAALADLPSKAYLLLQLSLVIAALPFTIWVMAASLRLHMRS